MIVTVMSDKNFEIDQDLNFQEREWRWERISWIVIASIMIAGLMGLFGHHPFARVRSQTPNGQVVIDYERFGRYDSSGQIFIKSAPAHGQDNMVHVWLDAEYLDAINVVSVSPWPLRGEAREGQRAFVFRTDGTPFSATLSIQFRTMGLVRGRVGVSEQEPVSLTHMVWP